VIATALGQLNSPDRYLRYAARIALEWQPIDSWKDQVLKEKRPTALINGMVGLIRANARAPEKLLTNAQQVTEYQIQNPSLTPRILDALNRLNLKSLSEEQLLEALRAYSLAFIRLGKPDDSTASAIANRINPLFPNPSPLINKEASQLLAYLQHPEVVPKSVNLLFRSRSISQEEQLHYVMILRVVKTGWTPDLRRGYFLLINFALNNYKGGASFKRFLARIKEDAEKTLTPAERKDLEQILKGDPTALTVRTSKPRQFIRNWQMQDLLPDIDQSTTGRNFQSGQAAFLDAQCAACHRFNTEGGATGPDLTGVGNRFQPADVLEAILLPSKIISDQYQTHRIDTADPDTGNIDTFVGRITYEDDTKLQLATNPFTPDTTEIPKTQIKSKSPAQLSMMPQSLVDNLTKEEILDLIAYLRSAGDPKDKAFAK
jgi:putative heme-binding domain-containing protein